MVRHALDRVYVASGYIAATFLVCIAVLIIAQVAGRFLVLAIDATELAGYCLAATTYFGLAYTFRKGSHIRVDLIIRHVNARIRRGVEIWCCGAGMLLLGYFAYYTVRMTWKSYIYGDVSTNLVAIPLWIPQFAMAAGAVTLTIAVADELVWVLGGRKPHYEEMDAEEFALLHGTAPPEDTAFGSESAGGTNG